MRSKIDKNLNKLWIIPYEAYRPRLTAASSAAERVKTMRSFFNKISTYSVLATAISSQLITGCYSDPDPSRTSQHAWTLSWQIPSDPQPDSCMRASLSLGDNTQSVTTHETDVHVSLSGSLYTDLSCLIPASSAIIKVGEMRTDLYIMSQGRGTSQLIAATSPDLLMNSYNFAPVIIENSILQTYSHNITVTIPLVAQVDAAASIVLIGGDGQTGVAGSALDKPFRVRVYDGHGSPVAGFPVMFRTPSGGSFSPNPAMTDSSGYAESIMTLPVSAPSSIAIGIGNANLASSFKFVNLNIGVTPLASPVVSSRLLGLADLSFGPTGMKNIAPAQFDLTLGLTYVNGVIPSMTDSKGRIVIAGIDFAGPTAFIYRVLPNGEMDPDFAGGQIVTFPDMGGSAPEARLGANDSIYVTSNTSPEIAHVNSDGSMDSSFGLSGVVLPPNTGGNYYSQINSDGTIWATGWVYKNQFLGNQKSVSLLNADGSSNPALSDIILSDWMFPVVGQLQATDCIDFQSSPRGLIIHCLDSPNGNYNHMFFLMGRDGTLDRTFGTNGLLSGSDLGMRVGEDHRVSMLPAANGGFYIQAWNYTDPASLLKLTSLGALDPSYNNKIVAGSMYGLRTGVDGRNVMDISLELPDGSVAMSLHGPIYSYVEMLDPSGNLDLAFGDAGAFPTAPRQGADNTDFYGQVLTYNPVSNRLYYLGYIFDMIEIK